MRRQSGSTKGFRSGYWKGWWDCEAGLTAALDRPLDSVIRWAPRPVSDNATVFPLRSLLSQEPAPSASVARGLDRAFPADFPGPRPASLLIGPGRGGPQAGTAL